MSRNIFSFKTYLFKEEEKVDYFTTLEDELGVDQGTIKDIFQKDVFINSHFSFGDPKIMYKMQSWEIVPGSLNDKGCLVRLKKGITDKSYLPSGKKNKAALDTKEYYLDREELLKFLTTAWSPPQQASTDQGAFEMPPTMPQ